MSQCVSNRHESDLGGRFLPFGNTKQVGVTIVVSDATASLPSVQHTAWMLVNLLGRFQGVVHRLSVRCPVGVKLSGRVVPLATRDIDLATALIDGGNAIGVVPIDKDVPLERTIVVGTGALATGADLFVLGGGWCGGISISPERFDKLDLHSSLPFGPYVAACIAAGEVFKAARMQSGTFASPGAAFYSCWNHLASDAPISGGPSDVEVALNASLVGIGAVGSSLVHAIWACPDIAGSMVLIDNDPKGLEMTNLNRYPLFGNTSVGQQKATAGAQVASDAKVRWIPHDAAIESFDLTTPRVVSAVDRNSARAAIQFKYPARLLSGSTLDLRSEVLRCGPPGVGACLRCFNEPERIAPDEMLRSKLRGAKENEIAELANSAGITIDEAKEWIATGRCGIAGDRLLPLLRRDDGQDTFAVAFVSVMAGTMLAAELVKDHLVDAGPLSESQPRATYQFFSPLARSNRASAFRRDPNCPMCDPTSVACSIWAERYQSASKSKA